MLKLIKFWHFEIYMIWYRNTEQVKRCLEMIQVISDPRLLYLLSTQKQDSGC